MEKKINCVLEVEDRSFTNKEDGEVVEYKGVTAVIDGVRINLSVKKDSKGLFDYILDKIK